MGHSAESTFHFVRPRFLTGGSRPFRKQPEQWNKRAALVRALGETKRRSDSSQSCARSVRTGASARSTSSRSATWAIEHVSSALALYNTSAHNVQSLVGPKFNPSELFDISTRSRSAAAETADGGSDVASVLQVKVPANLMRRTTLSVTIEKGSCGISLLDRRGCLDNAKSRKKTFRQRDIEFMKVDPEKSKEIAWQKALKWAQDTLIFRDIFNQVRN